MLATQKRSAPARALQREQVAPTSVAKTKFNLRILAKAKAHPEWHKLRKSWKRSIAVAITKHYHTEYGIDMRKDKLAIKLGYSPDTLGRGFRAAVELGILTQVGPTGRGGLREGKRTRRYTVADHPCWQDGHEKSIQEVDSYEVLRTSIEAVPQGPATVKDLTSLPQVEVVVPPELAAPAPLPNFTPLRKAERSSAKSSELSNRNNLHKKDENTVEDVYTVTATAVNGPFKGREVTVLLVKGCVPYARITGDLETALGKTVEAVAVYRYEEEGGSLEYTQCSDGTVWKGDEFASIMH